MSLWVDKYRPTSLGALDFHPAITSQLRKLVRRGKANEERGSTEERGEEGDQGGEQGKQESEEGAE